MLVTDSDRLKLFTDDDLNSTFTYSKNGILRATSRFKNILRYMYKYHMLDYRSKCICTLSILPNRYKNVNMLNVRYLIKKYGDDTNMVIRCEMLFDFKYGVGGLPVYVDNHRPVYHEIGLGWVRADKHIFCFDVITDKHVVLF